VQIAKIMPPHNWPDNPHKSQKLSPPSRMIG
jgi:hypothetical protein